MALLDKGTGQELILVTLQENPRMANRLARRILGRTGLEITQLGYGTSLQELSAKDHGDRFAGELLNAVLDAGINFMDTAPDYGLSEGGDRRGDGPPRIHPALHPLPPRLSHCHRGHRQARPSGREPVLRSGGGAASQLVRQCKGSVVQVW